MRRIQTGAKFAPLIHVPKLTLFALTIALFLAPAAHATITQLGYWRMGEADPSDTPGATASTTTDVIGGKSITLTGASTYQTVTSSLATSATGSSTAIHFPSGSYGTAPLYQSITSNFGIEAWVNVSSVNSANQCVAYNGGSGSNGWGIYVVGGKWGALFGDVTFIVSSTAVTTGTWTHVALVDNNGTTTLYVNGSAVATSTSTPATPSGSFGVAMSPGTTGTDPFSGSIDELRVFTFAAGAFSVNDLLIYAGPPTVTSSAATAVSANSATFNGTFGANGLNSGYYFQYGTTTSYGTLSTTNGVAASKSTSSVSFTANNLTMGTLYHYQLVGTNSAGMVKGADETFTTTQPKIISQADTGLTTTSATLETTVNPEAMDTSVQFVYGFTTNYGSATPGVDVGSGTSNVGVTNTISYLFNGCTYHYAVVLSGGFGTITGADNTFTLPGTATATVNTIYDDGSPGCLRNCISNAASGGTINFGVAGTMVLSSPLPAIFKSLTINGPGTGSLTISGSNTWRIFFVDAAAGSVNLNNLTLANGHAQGGAGGNGGSGGGGGLGAGGALFVNNGSVTLSNIVFSGNSATGGSGGSWVEGDISGGGGGGLGGNGATVTPVTGYGAGGGGGFMGNGGGYDSNGSAENPGGGGGGGFIGNGGNGFNTSGGGGGGLGNGQEAPNFYTGGAAGVGGGGVGDDSGNGGSGQTFGGGGGAGYIAAPASGGYGGEFGGGGGGNFLGSGGNGGDFGGGGGADYNTDAGGGAHGGTGGFGGGGGGANINAGGRGGFGGGGGGGNSLSEVAASGGAFGGSGGYTVQAYPSELLGGFNAGGGGAALGGVVFVRGNNQATVTYYNTSIESGQVTPGSVETALSGGVGPTAPTLGQAVGSSLFGLGGLNVFNVSTGTNTVSGSIADYSNNPAEFIKLGAGTLVFAGTNNYIGSTFVNAGTLIVAGDNSSSSNTVVNAILDLNGKAGNITVDTGGLLSGNGVAGNVTVLSSGFLAGTPSVNALTISGILTPGFGTVTATNASFLGGSGKYYWDIYNATGAPGVGYSTLNVQGTLNLSNSGTVTLDLGSYSSLTPSTQGHPINFPSLNGAAWTIIQTTGGIQGFNAANWVINGQASNPLGGFSSSLANLSFAVNVVGTNLVLFPVAQPFLSLSPVTGITSSNAVLNCQVNPYSAATSVYFLWGTTSSYGSTNVVSIGSGSTALTVTNQISALAPGTTSHWQIVASNSMGSVSGGDQTFTTTAGVPQLATLGATNITTTGATLLGAVNPEGAASGWYFKYGPTTSYGSATTTNTIAAGTSTLLVNSVISGLSPATTYHFIIGATNGIGTGMGGDLVFTTANLQRPTLVAEPVTSILNSNATLNAQVNPNGSTTTVYFEWGTTPAYGTTNVVAAGSYSTSVPVSDTLSGLAAFTIYHYQIIASNAAGTTSSGDLTFTSAYGPLTVLNWWRLGEADLNAVAGGIPTTTIDSAGSENLTVSGGATYSTNVSSAAASRASSSLSMCFTNGASYAGGSYVPTSVTTNFGFEMWVYPTSTSDNSTLFYNGNPGSSGFGLGQIGSSYRILFGGIVFQPEGTVIPNTWTHIAVVCQNGTAVLYTNGVAAGSVSAIPNPAVGAIAIGANPGGDAGTYFSGLIDEVRIFTFSPGSFSTNYLLLNTPDGVPAVSSVSAVNISTNGATLSATITPNVPNGASVGAWFEYGLTTNYGTFTATNTVLGGSAQSVTNVLAGLSPGTLYHFRADGLGLSLPVQLSTDQTFVTLDVPRTISALPQTASGHFSLQFVGSPAASYTVLATTNLGLPASSWTVLGTPTNVSNNVYQFTDPSATNRSQYYMLKSQ